MSQFKYRAFISYSHQDKHWGDWLHKALETWRVPDRLVGKQTAVGAIPKRLAPIFRDRDELPSATDLGSKVNEALAQSANLIVICSPRSAASFWVNEEVRGFKRLGREDRVFCLIVAGEPHASDRVASDSVASNLQGRGPEECFAPALRYRIGPDGGSTGERTEPIAADARPGKDGRTNAKLKLISGLLGIGFDELRQREQQRAHRRLAAVAVFALAIMTLTSVLAVQAVIARHAAERRQKQAESLVDFMLGDLNDKLAQVQRLDIMEAVDDQAMRYFQSLPTTDVTDEALAHRAKALEKIGSVRFDQGHLPAAMQAFQSSLKFAAALAGSAPQDAVRQLALARTWAYIGMTHWQQGQLDAAQRSFGSAQAILQRAQAHAASGSQLQFELSTIDNNIGHVLEARGRFDEAAVQYQEMLAVCQTLVAAEPDNAEWAAQLGLAHNNLGKLALLRGDLKTALARYAADDAIESKLSARDHKDNNQREKMAIARATLGRTLAMAGEVDAGLGKLRQAVAIAAELEAVDPGNASFREDLALYAGQLGRLLRLSGDLPSATRLVARSITIFQALVQQDPGNSGWQRELAEVQLEHAAQSRASGESEAARAEALAALQRIQPLLARQPDDRTLLLVAIASKLLLADVAATRDAAAARRWRSEALNTLQLASGDPRWRALRAEALLTLGRKAEARPLIERLRASGYRDPALLAVLQRARIDYPPDPAFQQHVQALARAAPAGPIPPPSAQE